jgi:hypothetical protein
MTFLNSWVGALSDHKTITQYPQYPQNSVFGNEKGGFGDIGNRSLPPGYDDHSRPCPEKNTDAETPYQACGRQWEDIKADPNLAAEWRARGWMRFEEGGQTGVWCLV